MDKIIVQNYIRRKKRHKLAAILGAASSVVLIVFIVIAFCWFYVDRFTIHTNSDPELCLTIDENKQRTTTKLVAPPLIQASDMQYSDLPANIDEGLGSKNKDSYFAYSFYLGGVGNYTKINYAMDLRLNNVSNNIEEAIRIMIIRNGDSNPDVYAKANPDGSAKWVYDGVDHNEEPTPIKETKKFEENQRHIIYKIYDIKPGDFDKFTIVMWIDGWYSDNTMKGGVFETDLKFSTASTQN